MTSSSNKSQKVVSQYDEIENTFKLLREGEEKIKLSEKFKELTLILGNTGSGKSTLLQWIAGDNTKLMSVKVGKEGDDYDDDEEEGDDYIIEDGNRIGRSMKSKTIFPELVVENKTNSALYDCPGFSDTRSTSNDIATTYFIKKLTDHALKVKIVLVVNFFSVKQGADRIDFMKMVEHATEVVRNVKKFQPSIALVVTKVDRPTIKTKRIIKNIATYLNECKQSMVDSLNEDDLTAEKKNLFENAITLVNALLTKKGNDYSRIGIFKTPNKKGPISEIEYLEEGKETILKMINEDLEYTSTDQTDFGHTISDKSKYIILSLVEKINKSIENDAHNIVEKLQFYFNTLAKRISANIKQLVDSGVDITKSMKLEALALAEKYNIGSGKILELAEEIEISFNIKDFVNKIKTLTVDLSIESCNDNIALIVSQEKYLSFLEIASNKNFTMQSSSFMFKPLKISISHSKDNINRIIDDAAETLTKNLQSQRSVLFQLIERHYIEGMEKLEIESLTNNLIESGRIFEELKQKAVDMILPQEFTEHLIDIVTKLDISSSNVRNSLITISNQEQKLAMLEMFRGEKISLESKEFFNDFEKLLTFLSNAEKWYIFLSKIYLKLSSFEIQMEKRKNHKMIMETLNSNTSKNKQSAEISKENFEVFLKCLDKFQIDYESVKQLEISEVYFKKLNQLIQFTLQNEQKILCAGDELVLMGEFIKFSDFVDSYGNLEDFCGDMTINAVNIFSSKSVFVNKDLDFIGKEIQLSVIAPKWEIIGSRSINLNGLVGNNHSPSRAPDGKCPGCNGDDGKPGLPGGTSGNFFGIGEVFKNIGDLTINTSGGQGGDGQDGGDGAEGRKGARGDENDYNCDNNERYMLLLINLNWYICQGSQGEKGGSGGNGGAKGLGGYNGHVKIFSLSEMIASPIIKNSSELGYGGQGGKGGEGGYQGDYLKYRQNNDFYTLFQTYRTKTYYSSYFRGPKGSDGADSSNTVGREQSVSVPMQNFVKILIVYKKYLRENIENIFSRNFIVDFHKKLDGNNDIKSSYKTIDLVDELKTLEEQSQFLQEIDRTVLTDFYKSLLNRTIEQAESSTISKERKVTLNYLYTAVLSKIHNLRADSNLKLIVDIEKYFESIKSDVTELGIIELKSKKATVILSNTNRFKNSMDKKISESNDFITNRIIHEIENIFVEINRKIDLLVEEDNDQMEAEILKERREDLRRSLLTKKLYDSFGYVVKMLGFISGAGALVSTITDVVSQATSTFISGNDEHKTNETSFLNQLAKMVAAIGNFEEDLKERQSSEIMNTTLKIGKFGLEIFNKLKINQNNTAFFECAFEQVEETAKKVKPFESKIFSDMISISKHMEESLREVSNQLNTKSKPSLDVTKWRMKSFLKGIRSQFKKFTKGFDVESDFLQCIEKLEEAVTTLIDVYDRIEEYKEQKELNNHISNLAFSDVKHSEIDSPDLNSALLYLEETIRANIVLDRYKIASNALKQHVFPLAHNYMQDLFLPYFEYEERDNNFKNYVNTATKQVDIINKKLKEYKTSIQKHDDFIFEGCFKREISSARPFHVWSNSNHKDMISKLLSGEKIAVKADIFKSDFDKDAIKFNEIGINFHSKNETIAVEIKNLMKNFKIYATHMGNSIYRFKNDIYSISSDSQNFVFSFEKDSKGEPIQKNNVYSKIKSGNVMLSPYAMWEFQLSKTVNQGDFSELMKFKDDVDLELIGCGSYLSKDALVDKDNIDKYYKHNYDLASVIDHAKQDEDITNEVEFQPETTMAPNISQVKSKKSVRYRREILNDEPISSGASQNKPWMNKLIDNAKIFLNGISIEMPMLFSSGQSSTHQKSIPIEPEQHFSQNLQNVGDYTIGHFQGSLLLADLLFRKMSGENFHGHSVNAFDPLAESEVRLQAGLEQWRDL